MELAFRTIMGDIWDGLDNINLFDLNITFTQFFMGIFVVGLSIRIFKTFFSIENPISQRAGSRRKDLK